MGFLARLIGAVAPGFALQRARNRAALGALMNYDAATTGTRLTRRGLGSDADAASARRARLAYLARDLVRNTPFALRAQQVIANNVVGDGIIWKVKAPNEAVTQDLRGVLKRHFDSVAIDADGRNNLYGLQRLVINGMVDAGEVLIRRRRRARSDGLPLPFQLQVLEADYIDNTRDGVLPNGNEIREGIEFDAIGRRVNYWLFTEHPGSNRRLRGGYTSRAVPASEILHIYRQDRAGQMRGVTWFAPVALALQDLGDGQDAQLMRQKIAACFAAFRIAPEDEKAGTDAAGLSESLVPGRIQNLAPGEDIKFSTPPGVDGYDEFTRAVLRSVAAGLGITYEALTGDLSNVNFSSGRMGRMEMDRNVSAWQWLMLIPQMMQPLAAWTMEAIAISDVRLSVKGVEIEWTPPHRILVDPAREIAALRDKVKAGFTSRQSVIRELGFDPEEVIAEIKEDQDKARELGLTFDTDLGNRAATPPQTGGPNGG
jgi:lambda family phage portal protein